MEVHSVSDAILDNAVLPTSRILETTTTDSPIRVLPVPSLLIDPTFSSTTTNLTSSALNAQTLASSDEYFAKAENLLTPGPAVRKAGVYVHTGAWFDGWETRRHNQKAFDWVVIKLGCVGQVEGVEIDTAHFNGNEAPAAGLDGCFISEGDKDLEKQVLEDDYTGWNEILPKQECGPSQRQAWRVSGPGVTGKEFTHLRLKMYPDGGIARLRVYGKVVPPPLPPGIAGSDKERPLEDLASTLNGGVAVACSDEHFGVKSNLTLPGRGKDMGDGWETARSRTPGHVDWVIVKLGLKGKSIEKVVVDTKDFRGNFPQAVRVEGWPMEPAKAALGTEPIPKADSPGWVQLTHGEQPCKADAEHVFEGDQLDASVSLQDWVWTHVKMTMIPDGGVKRLRIFGRRA